MTVRLTVRRASWRSRVARLAGDVDGLVPVVKGNGYGLGRTFLAGVAAEFADTIAVGTVHELDVLDAHPSLDVVVLTPVLAPPATTRPILTVGRQDHLDALRGWGGRVVVKLASSMQRYGGSVELIEAASAAGLDVAGVSVHPPLVGTDDERVADVERHLADVDPSIPVWVSHLSVDAYRSLPTSHSYRLRLGTSLWHADKNDLHLEADVIDVRPVAAGERAGYRLVDVPGRGHLVMIGAGTAHGVTPLPDGRSPFHHARTRLPLLEPPHMHTSMAWVPTEAPCPAVGGHVDVQRPLHMTSVDEYRWL